jgi:hypothetical protein
MLRRSVAPKVSSDNLRYAPSTLAKTDLAHTSETNYIGITLTAGKTFKLEFFQYLNAMHSMARYGKSELVRVTSQTVSFAYYGILRPIQHAMSCINI